MMLINHLAVSLTAWNLTSMNNVFSDVAPWSYALVALGTALPDIDHPQSTLGSRVKWLSWPIRFIFGHRTITHSVLAIIAVVWASIEYPPFMPVAFGFVFHLVGDYFTVSGLKLFWPINKVFKAPVLITTNGAAEYLLVWSLSAILLTWYHSPEAIYATLRGIL